MRLGLMLPRRNVANELGELDRIAGTFQSLGHVRECAMRGHTGKDAVKTAPRQTDLLPGVVVARHFAWHADFSL
jgi:hypothetical protein